MENNLEIFDAQIESCIKQPENLINIFITYSGLAASSNPVLIDEYSKKIDTLISKLLGVVKEAKGLQYLNYGLTHYYRTRFKEVFEPINTAIKEFEKIRNNNLKGLAQMILGANYRSLGEIDEALRYLYLAVENVEENGPITLYKCFCYYQLAEINISVKDYAVARELHLKSVRIAEKINSLTGMFRSYSGLANLYMEEADYDKSLEFLNKTLELKGLTDSQLSRTLCDKGILFYNKGEFGKSKEFLEESYNIRKTKGLADASSTSLINLGKSLLAIHEIEEAVIRLEEALSISLEYNSRSKLMDCYHLLADGYAKQNKWEKSVKAYQEYDYIQREENAKQIQKIYKIKNDKIEKQRQLIQEKHKEITDSINYAERIQRSFLATKETLNANLKNYFVFFKPKDVVSGDFYWAGKLKNGSFAVVNADSTGHGVPGAIMSILNISSIEKAVDQGLTEPAAIFNATRKTIIERLKKDGSEQGGKDGMDASIVCFDFESSKFTYTAANNPIWIIRNNELIEIKPDKMPVGKHDNDNTPFNQGEFNFQKGDLVYMLTDGFPDQFGGEKGKKFMSKNLKTLLVSIAHLSMNEQEVQLHEIFTNWVGDLEQVDDVCLIGVRV